MLYASECWPMKNQHVHKMSVAEMMMMLKWTNDKTIQDRVRNENVMGKWGVAPIKYKVR